ncbi:hypothetical protein GC175_20130 [bacterium]|nr:hypothetical protein [bacterium]
MPRTITTPRHKAEFHIVEQAQGDPALRRLLDNPKATLADFVGLNLLHGLAIPLPEKQPGYHTADPPLC